jgi:hypothetical protein
MSTLLKYNDYYKDNYKCHKLLVSLQCLYFVNQEKFMKTFAHKFVEFDDNCQS